MVSLDTTGIGFYVSAPSYLAGFTQIYDAYVNTARFDKIIASKLYVAGVGKIEPRYVKGDFSTSYQTQVTTATNVALGKSNSADATLTIPTYSLGFVIAIVQISANSSGKRQLGISTSSASGTMQSMTNAAASGITRQTLIVPYENNTGNTKKLYLNANQNSGTSVYYTIEYFHFISIR